MDFNQLKKHFEYSYKKVNESIEAFPWEEQSAYASWLRNSYHYAHNSTRILALAGGVMPSDKTSTSNRFIAHANEEKGHEKLLENDLKFFGLNINDIPVTYEMKEYYQSLYFWLSPAGNPIGLFGWILSLEGLAVKKGNWIYNITKNKFGPKATSFLRVHSDADPDHLEKALTMVSQFSHLELDLVADTLEQYNYHYCLILNSIKQNLNIKPQTKFVSGM